MRFEVPTKSKNPAGILTELATLSAQAQQEPNSPANRSLRTALWQMNQSENYLNNLPLRIRSIPQHQTLNETHLLATGGLSLSWADLPKLFEPGVYRTSGEFEITVSKETAGRFINGAIVTLKHKDNLFHRPEYIKTFENLRPIQFFKAGQTDPKAAERAKTYFAEEALRERGPEFTLAKATVLSINGNTLRIRVDQTLEQKDDKQKELITPFQRHLAYHYSLSLSEFVKQIPHARLALNSEAARAAQERNQSLTNFLHNYTTLCLASPKHFNQIPPKTYLAYTEQIEASSDQPSGPKSFNRLLTQRLVREKEANLPSARQDLLILPGQEPQIAKSLLEKTGTTSALEQNRSLLEHIAGPSATQWLTEILLNIYSPLKPLDHQHTEAKPNHKLSLRMQVANPRDTKEAEQEHEALWDLRSSLNERYSDNSLLDDPSELTLQYRQKNAREETLLLSTQPSFVGTLRYTPDNQNPQTTGLSYSQRIALAIEQITPTSDKLPLNRFHYTGSKIIALFQLPNNAHIQALAKNLAQSVSAAREENQIDRLIRRLLREAHFDKTPTNWTTSEAKTAFDFACAQATHTNLQLSRVSNPIPFLLRTGAISEAQELLSRLPEHQKLDLALRARAASSKQILTAQEQLLEHERNQASSGPAQFAIAAHLATITHQNPPTQPNELASCLNIRQRSFSKEELPLDIPTAANLLKITATAQETEETLQKLRNRTLTLHRAVIAGQELLDQKASYQLQLDSEKILSAIQTPDQSAPNVGPKAGHPDQDSTSETASLLGSLAQGRKATPWTPTAALLLTSAQHTDPKENSALLKIPGEKPIAFKIKMTEEGPSLRTLNPDDQNAQFITEKLSQEIQLLHQAQKGNTLSPTEKLSFHQAEKQLNEHQLPAKLSALENIWLHQEGTESLKACTRILRTQLSTHTDTTKETPALTPITDAIQDKLEKINQCLSAIANKHPDTIALAQLLTLDRKVHETYRDQTNQPAAIALNDQTNTIQTNRLWIAHYLESLQLNPTLVNQAAKAVQHALEENRNPLQISPATEPATKPNTKAKDRTPNYEVTFATLSPSRQFQITPEPFTEALNTIKQTRDNYRMALQHAVQTGILELPPATPNQNKHRSEQAEKAREWIRGI